MIGPDPNDPAQVDAVATVLGNTRGGRRGMAHTANVLEMLETMGFPELVEDLRQDARAVLVTMRDWPLV